MRWLARWWLALVAAVGFAIGWVTVDWWARSRYQPGDEDDAYWFGRA